MDDNGTRDHVDGDNEAAHALRALASVAADALWFAPAVQQIPDQGAVIGTVVPPQWQRKRSVAAPDLEVTLKNVLVGIVGACDAAVERRAEIVAEAEAEAFEIKVATPVTGGQPRSEHVKLIERGSATLSRFIPQIPNIGGVDRPQPLPRLDPVSTIDDVLDRLQDVIAWAVENRNGLGYFAAAYKRVTLAVKAGICNNDFTDGERMERFDVIFAQRYFDALNAYFDPGDQELPTHTWQWDFQGYEVDRPIILQHMLTSINAHVNLDLGIVAAQIGGDDMDSLEADFNQINAIMAAEMTVFLDTLAGLSRWVKVIRRLLVGEDFILGKVLAILRSQAWAFAKQLNANPSRNAADIGTHDAKTALLGAYYVFPTEGLTKIVQLIAAKESTDIAANIRAFDTGR